MEATIRERRRQQIINAANAEFSQRGYESARMGAIAERAGIGKSTVYEYFPSKQELLNAVADYVLEAALSQLHTVLSAEQPLREKLCRYYSCVAHLLQTYGGGLLQLQHSSEICRVLHGAVHAFYLEVRGALERALRSAADTGEIPADGDFTTAAILLMSLTNPSLVILNEQMPRVEDIVDFVIGGLKKAE